MPRIAVAVVNAVLAEATGISRNQSSNWPQLLAAAPADTLASLWQVMLVYLAWVVGAERRQLAGRATGRLTAAEKAAKKALAGVPCYHEQFLAAVGAPAAWTVGAHVAHVVGALDLLYQKLHWKAPIAASSSSSSNGSSSSSSAATSSGEPEELDAAHLKAMHQLAASVPCAEALLLLLEVQLSYLYLHQLDSLTIHTMAHTSSLIGIMLRSADETAAPPEATAAAVALLQAAVQHLPPAALHAAAAVGCEGLRPGADEYSRALVVALQVQYAKLLVLVPIYASESECMWRGLPCM
jgi:hypothetical protein